MSGTKATMSFTSILQYCKKYVKGDVKGNRNLLYLTWWRGEGCCLLASSGPLCYNNGRIKYGISINGHRNKRILKFFWCHQGPDVPEMLVCTPLGITHHPD